MPSIAMIWRAISRIAERPEESVAPAWLGLPIGFQIEARDRVASGDDAVVGPAGLRHQHVFVARGFRLDDVAGRGVPTSSSGVNSTVIGSGVVNDGARQLPDRFQRQVVAALHVEDAGAEAFVALAPPLQFLDACRRDARCRGGRRSRMPGSPCFGCGKRARTQPAKPCRPAMRSIVAPMIAISRGGKVEHALDRGLCPRSGFRIPPSYAAPAAWPRIKGKIGGIHGLSLSGLKLGVGTRCRAAAYEE